jgi:hypothetical protein
VIKADTDIQETHLNRKPAPKHPQTTQSKTQPKPKYPRTFNFLAIFQPDDEYLLSTHDFHFPNELASGLDMVAQHWFHHHPSFVKQPQTSEFPNCLATGAPKENFTSWFWASHLNVKRPITNAIDGKSTQFGLILHLTPLYLYLMPYALNHFMYTWWTQLDNYIPSNNPDTNYFNTFAAFIDNVGIRHGKFSEEFILYVNAKSPGIWASLQRIMANNLFSYSGIKFSVASVPGTPPNAYTQRS